MKDVNNWPTEECVGFSYAFKIVDCLTEQDLKSKSEIFYVLSKLVLYPVFIAVPYYPE